MPRLVRAALRSTGAAIATPTAREEEGLLRAERCNVRTEDLLVGLTKLPALNGAVRPDIDRSRKSSDSVEVSGLAVRVEQHRRPDVQVADEGARRFGAVPFVHQQHDELGVLGSGS